MEFENRIEEKKITLVATKAPEGMIVHTELGVSQKSAGPNFSKFQKKSLGNVKNFRVVRASEVGIEWRDSSGKKIKESDNGAKESYVWVSDKE